MLRLSLLFVVVCGHALAFSSRTSFAGRIVFRQSEPLRLSNTLMMRDRSVSYWFKVGDSVKVIDDVLKADVNLRGLEGVVMETWEKCDVDPTCCCAEQVDVDLAVRVQFKNENGEEVFMHYFAEAELVKVPKEADNLSAEGLPFDGMSCAAFKLDQLKGTSKRRGLASYDPMQPDRQ